MPEVAVLKSQVVPISQVVLKDKFHCTFILHGLVTDILAILSSSSYAVPWTEAALQGQNVNWKVTLCPSVSERNTVTNPKDAIR